MQTMLKKFQKLLHAKFIAYEEQIYTGLAVIGAVSIFVFIGFSIAVVFFK